MKLLGANMFGLYSTCYKDFFYYFVICNKLSGAKDVTDLEKL